MNIKVFIAPHERHDALEAYQRWLSAEQQQEIKDAPDGASIYLLRQDGTTTVKIQEK